MTRDVRQQMIELLPRMRRFAYSLTGSMDEADDVVQSACERALGRLEQFTTGTRLDSWMFRIVQTTWIDRRRYERRRVHDSDDSIAETVGFDARISEGTEARMALEIVQREVSRLPEEQRLVLSLVTIEGMTYQEAADVLGIPTGTVMSRLARARKRLAEAIERPGDRADIRAGAP
ncbi:MAG: RNA polymerase sigma factor [Hyphomicrobiaceae bacterium]